MGSATTIRGFVGPNGAGKTLAAVALVVAPALAEGVPVVGNVHLMHPNASMLESWQQLDELRDCVLFLDEITAVFPSRQSSSMPPQVARKLNQLRKVNVRVVWTAPHWSRADVILRQCTQLVTVCRGMFADPYVRTSTGVLRDERGRKVRRDSLWQSWRLFRFLTYDAVNYEDLSLAKLASKDVKALQSMWYRRNKHADQWLYDTMQEVDLMSHLDDVGMCVICGGSRSRPKCTCERDEAPKARSADGESSGSGVASIGAVSPWEPVDILPSRS